jgi:hypothetical protein
MKGLRFTITLISSLVVTGLIIALVGCGAAISPFSPEEMMAMEESSINAISGSRNGGGDEILLQAFHWNVVKTQGNGALGNGYDAHTSWYDIIKNNADDMADIGITMVWMPPPWKDDSAWWGDNGYPMGGGEGYYWHDFSRSESYALNNSRYGSYNDLNDAVNALTNEGIQIIYDIVPNHRDKGKQQYKKFYNWGENWSDDNKDGFTSGDNDVNTDREYDHYKNALLELKNYYGADGFRWDFVRGYHSGRVDAWMDAVFGAGQGFSVGELWKDPIGDNQLISWSNGADSTVMDFALKKNFNANSFGGLCSNDNGYNRERAVTFLDNHDTGYSPDCGANDGGQHHWAIPGGIKNKAHAYILSMPGTPCLYWPDVFDGWSNQTMIRQLIKARKDAGVKANSSISWQSGQGQVAAIINDKLALSIGHSWSPSGSEWKEYWEQQGEFTVWVKDVTPPATTTTTTVAPPTGWSSCYYRGTSNSWNSTALTEVEDGIFEIENVTFGSISTDPRFKITRYNDWTVNRPDKDYRVDPNTTYTIRYDSIADTVSATPEAAIPTTTTTTTTTTVSGTTTTTTTVAGTTTTTTTTLASSNGDLTIEFKNCSSQNVWIPGDQNGWNINDGSIALYISGTTSASYNGTVTSSNIAMGTNSSRMEVAVCYNQSWGKWPFTGWTWVGCQKGSDGNIEILNASANDDVKITIDDGNNTITATVN